MNFLRQSPKWAIACLSILASTFVLAAADEASTSNALLECAALQDDARRLECFDTALSAPQSPAVSNETAATPPAEPASAAQLPAEPAVAAAAATVVVTAEETVVVSAEETVVVPAAEPPMSALDEFGMNAALAAQSANKNRPAQLTEISALVTHVRKRGYGELVVTLENGQVWTQKEIESGFRIKAGDTVTIRKGTFGGYRMFGRSNRSSSVVRVK